MVHDPTSNHPTILHNQFIVPIMKHHTPNFRTSGILIPSISGLRHHYLNSLSICYRKKQHFNFALLTYIPPNRGDSNEPRIRYKKNRRIASTSTPLKFSHLNRLANFLAVAYWTNTNAASRVQITIRFIDNELEVSRMKASEGGQTITLMGDDWQRGIRLRYLRTRRKTVSRNWSLRWSQTVRIAKIMHIERIHCLTRMAS